MKKAVIFLLLFIALSVQAQHYSHFSLWTRAQLIKNIHKNWLSTSTLIWRQQNDYHLSKYNPTALPLVRALQTQFSRFNEKQNFMVHFAQFTLMYHSQLRGKEADDGVPQNREWRLATGVEFIQRPTPKLTFNERFLQEFRFFSANDDKPVGRVRARIIGFYKLSDWLSLSGISELVAHDPPQSTGQTPNFRYHQFWLGGGLVWKLSNHLNLETSYTYINIRRSSKIEFDDQNVLNLFLTIR